MRAVLTFTLLAALVIAGAWWVAGLPGSFAVAVGPYSIETSAPVGLTLTALLFLAIYLSIRLLAWLFGAPGRIGQSNSRARRASGEQAVTRALVALAANDPNAASKEAARSRKLLGATPLTLLLQGQAHRQAGREGDAAAAFQQLAKTRGGAFLGHRGLLQLANEKQDWAAANAAAVQAEAAYPGAAWVKQERKTLALRTGQFRDALRLAGPEERAGLAIAAADAETDETEALRLAKQAFEADPALPPAALAYATRLRRAGRDKQAMDVLRRAWAKQPHPELAREALASITDPIRRVAAAKALGNGNPNHPETKLMLAHAALDAGLTAEARRQAEAARAAGLNQRRLYVLMADIAERDADVPGAQEALRLAAGADPDSVWRCGHCGTVQPSWAAICPACTTHGEIKWVQPDRGITPTPALVSSSPI